MHDLTGLTLVEAMDGLGRKAFSSRELTMAFIDAIDKANDRLNAYVLATPEKALAMADLSDQRRAAGSAAPLEGAPLAVKDLYCTKGVRTTACSKILSGFVPTYESTVTQNLWDAGAIMLGKLNMDEFAMGSSNETSCFGSPANPWRRQGSNASFTPGGSSGGSATAVAAGLCLAATASDTGGSVRQPAAFTGTVGFKPTYGRASRYGMIAFASSLDQAGPIAKTVADAALMSEIMCSHDVRDSTSVPASIPDWRGEIGRSVKGMRIGIPHEYRVPGMPSDIEHLWQRGKDWLQAMGATIVDISLKHTRYALPAYYIIAPAEASSNLARYDGMRYGARITGNDLTETYEATRASGFGAEVRRRLMIGTHVLSSGYHDDYYLRAQKVRARILEDFTTAFNTVDAILTPTCPKAAFAYGETSDDPVEMYLNDIFTATANLAGLPAISVPAALNEHGLPLGLQVIANTLDEATCFRVASALERAADFQHKPEKWWQT